MPYCCNQPTKKTKTGDTVCECCEKVFQISVESLENKKAAKEALRAIAEGIVFFNSLSGLD